MKEVPDELLRLMDELGKKDPKAPKLMYKLWVGQYNLPLTRSELEYEKEIRELEHPPAERLA